MRKHNGEVFKLFLNIWGNFLWDLKESDNVKTLAQAIRLYLLIQGYYSLIQAIFMLEINPLDEFQEKEKYKEFTDLSGHFKNITDG